MKKILILGGGTAGTLMSAKLRRLLPLDEWQITVVDQDNRHIYQPGLLFLPFGIYRRDQVFKPRARYIPAGVEFVQAAIDAIDPDHDAVRLQNGAVLAYDFLVIATGSRIVPEETDGLLGPGWLDTAFDFYTLEGSAALGNALDRFRGGRLVVNVVEMPIKCPVAPLEFTFLADWYFTQRGIRDQVEIVYATPLTGAFTKQKCTDALTVLFEQRGIQVVTEFNAGTVDGEAKTLSSFDGRELPYDLLVTVPTHRGSEAIARSGIGNELDFVPTDRHTLQSPSWPNVFILGDATDLPSSKAGSVAHFRGEVLQENLLRAIRGLEPLPLFDGHSNCFIETGHGKAILIDFNYDVEPLPGNFPLPGVGPLSLLRESELNHWGKLAFRWIYWNLLLRGAELPMVETRMSMSGKWS